MANPKAEEKERTKRKHRRMFEKYLNACIRFYGRLTVAEAYTIINQQNPGEISRCEFLSFICEEYCDRRIRLNDGIRYKIFLRSDIFTDGSNKIEDAEVIDYLLGVDTLYFRLERNKDRYPLYIPEKRELLKYADDMYIKITPQLETLASWTVEHAKENELMTLEPQDIYEEEATMRISGKYEDTFLEVVDWLALPRGIKAQREMLDTAEKLVKAAFDNTRIWLYRGHTPKETHELQKR